MKRVFLIDGHAQIFRMYYAFMRRPMVNSKGVDTSILFGFTKMLLELIAKEKPTHLAVAFDPPAKTFRHEAYPEYKANRSAAPELVKEALEPLQVILKAFDIPVVMIPGYEADDVIGSMASQWSGDDCEIFMVTPDKDYGQLISKNIYQYKPAKGGNDVEIIDYAKICSQYGISSPEQVIDILTIWGDSSDNVPGVKGIGEVGAKKLVGKYGGIGGILNNLGELPAKQQASINESREQLEMSRFLVTIKRDIGLPISLDGILLKPFNLQAIYRVFNDFEFNSLRKMLPAPVENSDSAPLVESADGVSSESADDTVTKVDYSKSCNETDASSLLNIAAGKGHLALSFCGEENLILAVEEGPSNFKYSLIKGIDFLESRDNRLYTQLKRVIEEPEILKAGYEFKHYIKRFRSIGIDLNSFDAKGELKNVADIEIMHYLINPERRHKEEILIKQYLKCDLEEIAAEEGEERQPEPEFDLFSSFTLENQNIPGKREIIAAALIIPLYRKVLEELEKSGQKMLYETIEMPLIAILSDMEWQGVKVDIPHLKRYSIELTKELESIEKEAREMAGEPSINLSSPKQIGILLYEKLGLNPKVKRSSKGNYPTDEETLSEMQESHPIIGKILEYRALKKLLTTYIDNFPSLVIPATGKVHTSFNQTVTATGRLSSTNPNLQNIPIRRERGKEIRRAFIPSTEDGYIVSADYSQIELRLMAHMSRDKYLVEAFNSGKDIHTATAARIFNIPEESVTKEQRSRAKVANFGIIYGISAFGLSQRLGTSRVESKALIEEYFKNYPGVKEYISEMINKAKEAGYVETIYGRRRFLPDINSRNATVRSFNERNAINAPLQGSAADIIKIAMINVYRRLKVENIRSKMVLQVHDELVFDVLASEKESVERIVKEEMESVAKLLIPLVADCNGGKNWLEAH